LHSLADLATVLGPLGAFLGCVAVETLLGSGVALSWCHIRSALAIACAPAAGSAIGRGQSRLIAAREHAVDGFIELLALIGARHGKKLVHPLLVSQPPLITGTREYGPPLSVSKARDAFSELSAKLVALDVSQVSAVEHLLAQQLDFGHGGFDAAKIAEPPSECYGKQQCQSAGGYVSNVHGPSLRSVFSDDEGVDVAVEVEEVA
jgi:hypothetical protein